MNTRPNRDGRNINQSGNGQLSAKAFLLVVVLAIVAVVFLCYLLFGNVIGSITIEAGEQLNGDDFLVMDWGMSAELDLESSKVDMSEPGDYIVKLRYHGSDFYSTLHVVDTMAPIVTVQDAVVYSGELPDPEIFIQQVQDGTPVTVSYVQTPDMSIVGEQEVQLCVTDKGGNAVFATANMTYTPDFERPQILGVNKLFTFKDSAISYRTGIIISDNCDSNPTLLLDTKKVDLSRVGVYDVVYRVIDAAGNMTAVPTTLTVGEKPDTFVEDPVVNAAADDVLSSIITDDMSATEKVEAVYDWVKTNYTYKLASDSADRMQSAYIIMTTYSGDCYSYASVCSLFFERLGLPQMIIQRSEDSVRSESTHYWNMVSVDGGENYYHFDTCPQTGFDVKICLATDAELLACNQYTPGYYTFDEEMYPETPME